MKTLGIIGGLGPESTIDYYRFLIDSYRQRKPDAYPEIIIVSLDLARGIRLVEANDLRGLADYLLQACHALQRAGAHFALMAANTPHIVFDPVQSQSPIPLLSIVDAARDQAQRLGLRKVGLLGTGFTMKGSFYPEVFSRAGIELRVPTPEEQDYIHDKYMNELLKNLFLPQTGERVMAIIEAMKARDAIEGVILAGTELPLILRQFETRAGIPFLDTTRIHVERAVREMLT